MMSRDQEDYKPRNVTQQEQDLRIQLLDYLFERGHKVSKPLIHAVSKFTYDYGQALYEQGKLVGPAKQGEKT
jgi:hypothetical protein